MPNREKEYSGAIKSFITPSSGGHVEVNIFKNVLGHLLGEIHFGLFPNLATY